MSVIFIDKCKAEDKYIEDLEECLDYEVPKSGGPAAIIIEPIQGAGGTVVFPKSYLKRTFELIRNLGGLCIADEVQTGWGRLGSHFWGFEAQCAQPDIVTMAKGIANGFPMGAVVTTKEIAESIGKAYYLNTFGSGPLACTAAMGVLQVIEEEGLQENALNVGTNLIKALTEIDSPFIGDVRGEGLMIGVELVSTKSEPGSIVPLEREKVSDIFESIKNHGVLVGKGGLYGNVLRIKPPMCITVEDAEKCVEAIASSIKDSERK